MDLRTKALIKTKYKVGDTVVITTQDKGCKSLDSYGEMKKLHGLIFTIKSIEGTRVKFDTEDQKITRWYWGISDNQFKLINQSHELWLV